VCRVVTIKRIPEHVCETFPTRSTHARRCPVLGIGRRRRSNKFIEFIDNEAAEDNEEEEDHYNESSSLDMPAYQITLSCILFIFNCIFDSALLCASDDGEQDHSEQEHREQEHSDADDEYESDDSDDDTTSLPDSTVNSASSEDTVTYDDDDIQLK